MRVGTHMLTAKIMNISGTSGMNHSGRVFAPPKLLTRSKDKGKAKVDQQVANHRGRMQLNDCFYQYTLHQHRQDPNPYPWPTLEKFRATVAWPGDRSNFQDEAGPTDAQGAA